MTLQTILFAVTQAIVDDLRAIAFCVEIYPFYNDKISLLIKSDIHNIRAHLEVSIIEGHYAVSRGNSLDAETPMLFDLADPATIPEAIIEAIFKWKP